MFFRKHTYKNGIILINEHIQHKLYFHQYKIVKAVTNVASLPGSYVMSAQALSGTNWGWKIRIGNKGLKLYPSLALAGTSQTQASLTTCSPPLLPLQFPVTGMTKRNSHLERRDKEETHWQSPHQCQKQRSTLYPLAENMKSQGTQRYLTIKIYCCRIFSNVSDEMRLSYIRILL